MSEHKYDLAMAVDRLRSENETLKADSRELQSALTVARAEKRFWEKLYEKDLAQSRERVAKLEALCDSNYAAGLAAGWNFGINEDREGLNRAVESHQASALTLLREASPPAASEPGGGKLDLGPYQYSHTWAGPSSDEHCVACGMERRKSSRGCRGEPEPAAEVSP